ncbi:MAG: lipopolysaccharide heptosyltransferase II [Armatimonadetes bacterium]|nr:lipopolysaccharide heptosyltransferase II [Armatimonadota bacterium]
MTRRLSLTGSERILIIKLSSIGDVVMATPVVKALRQAFPKAYIAWIVEEKSKDILIGNPYLDEVIVWTRNLTKGGVLTRLRYFLSGLTEINAILRSKRFDLVIDLQGLLRSAIIGLLTGARYRLGFDCVREGASLFYNIRYPSNETRIRNSQAYLDILRPLGIESEDIHMHVPINEDDRACACSLIGKYLSGEQRPIVALCPATTWPNKHWTEEGWAILADRLVSCFNALPVFLGSSVDIPLIERIKIQMRHEAVSLAGRTTLRQAAAVIEQCNLIIAVDTGLLHVAVALDRPVVGVFGPSGWQYFVKKHNFIPVAKNLPCIPCFRHPTCKDFDCMKAISPEDILAAVERLLTLETNVQSACRRNP